MDRQSGTMVRAGHPRHAGAALRCSLVGLLLLGMWPRASAAETVDQAYRAALKHYYGGRFAAAARGLERLVALPTRHEELYYNLGCTYYRLGKLGPAIYNFERALEVDGDFEDARYNLAVARKAAASQVKDVLKGAGATPWWIQVVGVLHASSWWVLFLVLWWSLLAGIFLLRFLPHGAGRAGVIAGNSFVALLCLSCALLLAGRLHLARGVRQAVVLADSVSAREGPDGAARSLFKVHAGLKVRLRGESSGWLRVRLANGLEGWLPGRELGRL